MHIKSPDKVTESERKPGTSELSGKSDSHFQVRSGFKTEFASVQKRLRRNATWPKKLISIQLELMPGQLPEKILDSHGSQNGR